MADEGGSGKRDEVADVRMLYQISIADIRESKAQEWKISLQVFLLYGAIVAADRFLPNGYDYFGFAAVLISGAIAVALLWTFRRVIVGRRRDLRKLEVHLSAHAQEIFKGADVWHDVWIPIVLTFLIVLGMAASAWIVVLPVRPLVI